MVDCKICEHPYCQYAGEQRGFVINCTNYMPRQKPKTNADRIRAMSDEELARMWSGTGCPRMPSDDVCDSFGDEYNCCHNCWIDWLRQPVKDGDG